MRSLRLPAAGYRFWAVVPELGGRYRRVVPLNDKVTIHNAFPDRGLSIGIDIDDASRNVQLQRPILTGMQGEIGHSPSVDIEDFLVPELRCPCGFVHELSTILDRGWVTFRDADHDRLMAAGQTPEPEKVIAPLLGRMYECPDCGRLMWRPPGSDDYQVYTPEKDAV